MAELAYAIDLKSIAERLAGSNPAEANMNKYTDAELKLFKKLGVDSRILDCVSPVTLYRSLALECFLEDRRGPEIAALRRAWRALENGSPLRKSLEFDKLIEWVE